MWKALTLLVNCLFHTYLPLYRHLLQLHQHIECALTLIRSTKKQLSMLALVQTPTNLKPTNIALITISTKE